MALGVRSYGSSLRMQNIYNPEALPDTNPILKSFARRVLVPKFSCVELDCGTSIGRRVELPEQEAAGLISLETNEAITEEEVLDSLRNGVFFSRVRDSVTCLSEGGTCAYCGNGYYARVGVDDSMGVGESYEMPTSARSYQNYIANTYSGSIVGFSPLASDPLSSPSSKWSTITSHSEMDRMCRQLAPLKVNKDEMAYLYTIEDILERALAIIATYGVYGNA
ncbi:hypothetical protein VPHD69_0008 [Vibrio phage D69]